MKCIIGNGFCRNFKFWFHLDQAWSTFAWNRGGFYLSTYCDNFGNGRGGNFIRDLLAIFLAIYGRHFL